MVQVGGPSTVAGNTPPAFLEDDVLRLAVEPLPQSLDADEALSGEDLVGPNLDPGLQSSPDTQVWDVVEHAQDEAEEIARLYNQRRQGPPPPSDNGNGHGVRPLEDDWLAETPQGPVSSAREPVLLPVVIKLIYDWCRGQGWHQGDGSMSAFVTDVVLCHWVDCMDKAIVVTDRSAIGGLRGNA